MSVYDRYLTTYTLVLAGLVTAKDLLRDDLQEQLAVALAVNHAKFSRNEPMTRTQLDHALTSQLA